jgi:membrane protein
VTSTVGKRSERSAASADDAPGEAGIRKASRAKRLRRLIVATVRGAHEDRVSRLAAEVAFFALVALPPTMLAILGSIGYAAAAFGPDLAGRVQARLLEFGSTFLAPSTMSEIVRPAVENTLRTGRAHLVSLGILLALWPASRATAVIVDAIRLAYGVQAPGNGWKRRITALGLTAVTTVGLVVLLPLLVAGPWVAALAEPLGLDVAVTAIWRLLYWPFMGVLGLVGLSGFYRLAIPERLPWRRVLPGSALALVVWLIGGFGVRAYASWLVDSTSVYGPFAAPVVLMLWLYVTGFAVLLGAELNGRLHRPDQPARGVRAAAGT